MIDFEDTLRHDLHERADLHRPAPGLKERVEERVLVHERRRRARRLAGAAVAAGVLLVAGVAAVEQAAIPTTTLAAPTPRSGDAGWEPMAEAPIEPRFQHTAVGMDGQVLVFGGYGADGEPAEGAALYDPESGTWQEVDTPPGDMGGATAAWADGQLLALDVDGGLTRFDPGTRSWSVLAGSPFGATSNAVTSATWGGDRLYVVNNADAAAGAAGYDPVTDEWERLDPPPVELAFFDAVWSGANLLVVGDTGAGGSQLPRLVVLELDVGTGRWRELPTPPLQDAARRFHGFAAWTGTELVVGGGQAATAEAQEVSRTLVEEDRAPTPAEEAQLGIHGMVDAAAWDPGTEVWRSLPDSPVPVTGLPRDADVWTGTEVVTWAAPPASADGRWAAPAGSTDGRPVLLDPATGTWSIGDVAPGGGRQESPATWTGAVLVWWSGEPTDDDRSPNSCCDPAPSGVTFVPSR